MSELNLEQKTSNMVHDVRNAVTILNMLAYTLETKLKDVPGSDEDLAIMKEELAKIDKIVSQYREDIRSLF